MSRHEPFAYKNESDLLRKAEDLGVALPFRKSIDVLFEPAGIGSKKLSNRFAVQPMEGCDAGSDGAPTDLTFRRYRRYGEGGSSLIWFEATSVVPEGRSNPHQLWIHSRTLDAFKKLVEETRKSARLQYGNGHSVFLVLQLTHSGRYSRPGGSPQPLAACSNPHLDKSGDPVRILTDDDLRNLRDTYIEAFHLAGEAGFDAVDLKACHGYLVHELLGARTRKNSRYGGSFENRVRFLMEIVERARQVHPLVQTALRLSMTDSIPFPYGFGVPEDPAHGQDLSEPVSLIRLLIEKGCSLMNGTIGNPHHMPHLGRPFDRALPGSQLPDEHPMEGVGRLIKMTAALQALFPETPFVGTGYSWLRQFLPHVGAAVVNEKKAAFLGVGRSAFAYPDAPRDCMETGSMDVKKVCIACSLCSRRMRKGLPAGCGVRDTGIYSMHMQGGEDQIP